MDGRVDEASGVTSSATVPVLVALAVLVVVSPRSRPPLRVAALSRHVTGPRRVPLLTRAATGLTPAVAAERVGRAVAAVVGFDLDAGRARRLGQTLVVGLAAGAVYPLFVAPAAALAWVAPAWAERNRRRRQQVEVVNETPDLVELFRLAIGAGLTVHLAVEAIVPRARGITGQALAAVPGRVALGMRLTDALDPVAECGDGVRPLVAALVASERYGVALGASLEQVALEARLSRRRRAEEAARRLPVLLLFPLVVCILPAFVLLTVVPRLIGSLPRITG